MDIDAASSSCPTDLQSVILSHRGRSSVSKSSHPLAQQRTRPRNRTHAHEGLPEDSEYQFHETTLGLFESFFADSQQHHRAFARRNNPGILFGEVSESSESESSDAEDDDDVAAINHGHAIVSRHADGSGDTILEENGRNEMNSLIPSVQKDGEIDLEHHENTIANTHNPTSQSNDDDDARCATKENDSQENNIDVEDSSFIPDNDLFKARWYADPWDRPAGQLWTKDVQNQHNLRAAIRRNGFTGQLGAWLFNQLRKRKGYRFPYNERSSLKKPSQTHAEYLAALKRRREEEHSHENQVKEYDEAGAIEECRWTLELYDKVYGKDWPEDEAETTSSVPNTSLNGHSIVVECDGEEAVPTRRKTRQNPSIPEPPKTEMVPGHNLGITIPPWDQRASVEQIEARNSAFNIHKEKVMKAAQKHREEQDARYFMPSAGEPRFSIGYRLRDNDGNPARQA